MKRPSPAQLDGLLVLHKPAGPTSTDCLNSIKRALGFIYKCKNITHSQYSVCHSVRIKLLKV